MIFSDPTFFLFFGIYFIFHVITPIKYRNLTIIFGGTVFYSYWNIYFIFIPYLLTATAYFGSLYLDKAENERSRKNRFIVTIAVLLIPLLFYKYTNFFLHSVIGLFVPIGETVVDIAFPLGVSFITFTVIAYVANVFSRKFGIERNPATLAAYVLFFPHLIAGPILRPHELIPQLKNPLPALDARFILGIAIFTSGLIKKLVFADQLAIFVDHVYAGEAALSGLDYVLAIYGFSLQIYCDFSGYTDMAIGLAILMRVRLPKNFRRPYAAESLVEFWHRWHITLSLWLRDYLYIPLGGSRHGFSRQLSAILITMVLGGLWHGASWTFVFWGFLHGTAIVVIHTIRRIKALRFIKSFPKWLGLFFTFHFVTVTWIFFRSPDMDTAMRMITGSLTGGWQTVSETVSGNLFPLFLLVVFLLTHRFDSHARIRAFVVQQSNALVLPVLVGLWVLAITVSAGSSAKFIYFDF